MFTRNKSFWRETCEASSHKFALGNCHFRISYVGQISVQYFIHLKMWCDHLSMELFDSNPLSCYYFIALASAFALQIRNISSKLRLDTSMYTATILYRFVPGIPLPELTPATVFCCSRAKVKKVQTNTELFFFLFLITTSHFPNNASNILFLATDCWFLLFSSFWVSFWRIEQLTFLNPFLYFSPFQFPS